MKEINGIPVYDLTIDMFSEEYGVSVISLVENPAVEKAFIALSDQKQIKLSIDEDRRIVTGVALRADFPIYRRDDKTGKEYYFQISPDQIEIIMQKFMAEKRLNMVNIEHDSSMAPDDVFLWESYQLTDKHKVGYPEFSDIETGSWMVSYKVNNDSVWNAIKLGKLKGFSPEIFGNLSEYGSSGTDLSKDTLLLTMYLLTNLKNMRPITKLKLAAAKAAKIDLASQALDDVTLYFLDSDELVEGIVVFDMNEADEYVDFPDGAYGWGDKVVTIKDSVVTSIMPKEAGEGSGNLEVEVASAEDLKKLAEVVNVLVSEFEKFSGATVDTTEIQELKSVNAKLSADLASAKTDLASIKAEFALMKQNSKGDFADPNPKPGDGAGERKQTLSTKDVESFYKK